MISNYVRVAFRNLVRHKLFSFINVFGLALSLSFCLLVIMIIADQTSFDTFHPRSGEVYRVLTNAHRKDGDIENYASSPFPLGEVLAHESPAVERVVHFVRGLSSEADLGGSRIAVNGFFTDAGFFDVFGFRLEKGLPTEALNHPNSLVLTAETAHKLFGEKEAMGATVKLRGFGDFVVTGVFAPMPGKTHLEFDILGSFSSLPVLERERSVGSILTNWNNYYSNYSYVRLHSGHSPDELATLLGSIPNRFYGNLELESRDKGYSFELQRLAEITPGRILSQSLGRGVPQLVLYFLGALALVGMAAALFNYTNLTLARSLARAKEIGLRKVVGADRMQLLTQFMTESVLTALTSLLVAVALLEMLLVPGFRSLQLVDTMNITLNFDLRLIVLFIGFTFVVGLVAGLIPAAVMSGFRPAIILKDVSRVRVFSGLTLRKVLLVIQFSLSLVFFIILTVMERQVNHALTMKYGFDWKNTVTVQLQGQDATRIAQQLSQNPDVEKVGAMSHHPLTWEDGTSDVRVRRSDEATGVREYGVDANFVDLFGLSLVAGDNFHKDLPVSNERLVLVNERFVQRFRLGPPSEAIGHRVLIGDSNEVRIAGVVKDFFFKPATYELEPLMLRFTAGDWNILALKLKGGDVRETLKSFEASWKKLDPFHPFVGRLYDDIIVEVYDTFTQTTAIVGFLTVLAFVVSLLGLLGIVTFQVESRIKEIGIRQVLGAGMGNLLVMLARREIVLLLVATGVAIPLSLWIASVYLEMFAHRIELGPAVVLPAILIVYLCAGLTIGWQALRAAVANPVDALRYE